MNQIQAILQRDGYFVLLTTFQLNKHQDIKQPLISPDRTRLRWVGLGSPCDDR